MGERHKLTRVLSIDGGGIRGIIPGQVLSVLEAKLQARRGDSARLADYFDLIAGTSTGGILTCTYLCPDGSTGRPKFTAADAVALYLEHGTTIFDEGILHRLLSMGGVADERYPSGGLEGVLKAYFGDIELKDALRPCLVTAYDIERRHPFFFTREVAINNPGRNFHLRQVARATSAAPTFFEPALIHSMTQVPYALVDGGVFANNPALCAYAEARKLENQPTAKDMLIVSLGTGSSLQRYEHAEAKHWGLLGWARPVLDLMMSGVAETVHYQLLQIFDTLSDEQKSQYIRIDARLDAEAEDVRAMDNARVENMGRLREIGQELADEHNSELDRLADLLVAG